MKKEEFYKKVEEDINDILNASEESFLSDKKKLINIRLETNNIVKIDESKIWRETLFLSTNAITLLSYDSTNILAKKAIRECAEVYENLYKVSGEYEKEYCGILAALCYDIAGYQANALCIIREITEYSLSSIYSSVDENIKTDNYILGNITKLLNKKLYNALEEIMIETEDESKGTKLYKDAMKSFYNAALYGNDNDFLPSLNNVYKYFLDEGNTHISYLLFLLMYRLSVFKNRSVWIKLRDEVDVNNPQWKSYLKLLTINPFKDNEIQDSSKRISLFEFWMSQIEAIDSGYLSNNQNYVIQMPTSAGKTLIAELAILNALVKNRDKKCIYVAPYRSLTNEKEQELAKKFSLIGYSVTSLNGSYELDDLQVIIMDEADILIATPEKLDILFRVRPEFFANIALIVIDEGHIIGDLSQRSALLEFLMIRLKIKFPMLNTLFISAVLSEQSVSQLSTWISGNSHNVIKSPKVDGVSWEPTRRFISKFYWDNGIGKLEYVNLTEDNEEKITKDFLFVHKIGLRTYPRKSKGIFRKSETAAIIAYNLSNSGSTLIFCSIPRWSYSVASSLYDYIEYIESQKKPVLSYFHTNENSNSYKIALKWYGKDSIITKCINRGIGIHNGEMFEPVKRAIEEDYRNNILKILISTNTIGQGVNFPIKNLVIHSLVINNSKQDYKEISVRDFWNIIGRTGRAGLETEGQVIYLTSSSKDNDLFNKYIQKDNLENLTSYFSVLIEKLSSRLINNDEFLSDLEGGAESHLIHVLAEELYEDNGLDDIIEMINDNSLFKLQTNTENLKLLSSSLKDLASNVKNGKTKEEISAFSKTGLSLYSNEIILDYINENNEHLKEIYIADDYLKLLKHIYYLINEYPIREMKSNQTKKFENIDFNKGLNFIEAWLSGLEIESLRLLWADADDKYKADSRRMELFIQECLYFRYPWGISAFITLMCHVMDVSWNKLPKNIKSLSMYLRYGVNSQNACMALALGIKDRGLAIKISSIFKRRTLRKFISALVNITKEQLSIGGFDSYEIEELMEVGLKFNFKQKFKEGYVFNIRGIRFENSRKEISRLLKSNQYLTYEREMNNEYDPFAIAIKYNEKQVGYVPRDIAKIIATDMDLNDTKYIIKVIRTIPYNKDWNHIKVLMNKEKK
ncbi:DEAD/DEAH box helicase [Lysinibacillus sp. NPDC093190]|uniref:DEAD/DEAH box helicase n=1 Tax=Lysinibacillus sp. NPDC093190 TaxID=3390575 RepID=UPI003CFE75FD